MFEEIKRKMAAVLKRPVGSDELVFAATKRCVCGAGLAYRKAGANPYKSSWDCSDILAGRAALKGEEGSVQHTAKLPFVFYEVISEEQPSANGATTRP